MGSRGAASNPRGTKSGPRSTGSSEANAGTGPRPKPSSAPTELNRIIHDRVRLGIVSALAVNESLAFKDLKDLLRTTDGNLSVHARRLEEAGYVTCKKSFRERVPRTEYRLTRSGKDALSRYLDHMEGLIERVREMET